jgi:FkbM family methyltransferase
MMNTKWITSKLGHQYLIDADDKYMERCLMGSGYQIRNWEFAKTLCNPNGIALDIGASIGMNALNYSTYFSSVEAFEPDPDVYECMLETLAANNIDNVLTHPIAASDCSKTNILVKFHRATFGNTLKPVGYVGKTRPQLSIQCEPIDHYEFENVNLIKIDVEGNELAVLKGAEQTILKYMPVLQIEIKPQMLKRQLTSPQELWQWLVDRGYTAKHFAGDVTNPKFLDSEKFTSNSKYGIEYKIEFDNIKQNLVDFWFIKLPKNT